MTSHPNRSRRAAKRARGEALRNLREEMQRTQTELAEILLTTRDTVKKWESGERMMPDLQWEFVNLWHAFPELEMMRKDWRTFLRDGGPVVSYRRIDPERKREAVIV